MSDADLSGLRAAVAELDHVLQEADAVIRGLKLGVEAELPISDGVLLRWGRPPGQERRVLHIYDPDSGETLQGLTGATLPQRLAAAKSIPRLIGHMRQTRAALTEDVSSTARDLDHYLDTLGG